jgi:aminoglycoside/choline kinase family phosphotransferase
MAPDRLDDLDRRLGEWLAALGLAGATIEPLAGDLSSRRYSRVRTASGATYVAAVYPPELAEAQRRFSAAARLLETARVRVPSRVADDPGAGFALLEDLGPSTLYERDDIDWPARRPWFESALDAASRIAALPADAVVALGSPPLDAALLRRELEPALEHFLGPRGLATRELRDALDALCERLGAEPAVPCHRDFMARNLMPLAGGEVAVLDFQDLRLGPPAYDLASLLNDSLFAPESLEDEWRRRTPAGRDPSSYGRAVAQRCLKAVGTFVRFAARGQPRHLGLVPPTLARATRHLARLPETAEAFAALADGFAAAGRGEAIC